MPLRTWLPLLLSLIVVGCASRPLPSPAPPAPVVDRISPGVSGTWVLTVESPMGRDDVDARFAQHGRLLTGAVLNAGEEVPIEGTVEGERIHFAMNLDVRGQVLRLDYDGAVEGDSMSGTVQFGPIGTGKFTATRKQADAAE